MFEFLQLLTGVVDVYQAVAPIPELPEQTAEMLSDMFWLGFFL